MNKLHIEISPDDVKLEDSELFLKLWNKIMDENEIVPDNQDLTEFLTREINMAKNKKICSCCDGYGMVKGFKCIHPICNGRGYIN